MPAKPLYHLEDLLKVFQEKKILTNREILSHLGCSVMTAWRLLDHHGYFTSYNHNSRYYTIAGIPEFDEHGLWAFRNVYFSKWGALTDTIIALVESSPSGLTARRLEQLLHVKNVKPALTRLIATESLTREKIGPAFVYFPLPEAVRDKQRRQRIEDVQQARATRVLPPLEHVVALLVEIIRRPQNTPAQWARRLNRQGIRVTPDDIQAVLDHYKIDAKKGLLNF